MHSRTHTRHQAHTRTPSRHPCPGGHHPGSARADTTGRPYSAWSRRAAFLGGRRQPRGQSQGRRGLSVRATHIRHPQSSVSLRFKAATHRPGCFHAHTALHACSTRPQLRPAGGARSCQNGTDGDNSGGAGGLSCGPLAGGVVLRCFVESGYVLCGESRRLLARFLQTRRVSNWFFMRGSLGGSHLTKSSQCDSVPRKGRLRWLRLSE